MAIETCGTYAPIWMKGSLPKLIGEEVQNQLCANYDTGNG